MTNTVGHRFGLEAREISKTIGCAFKNVGLVYIDAAGISRRTVIKSVAKGMMVGKGRGGGEHIVGCGDGGVVPAPPQNWKERKAAQGRYTDEVKMEDGRESPDGTGVGRAVPPAYSTGVEGSVDTVKEHKFSDVKR